MHVGRGVVVREGWETALRFLRSSKSKFEWQNDEISSGHAESAPRAQVNWLEGLKCSRNA